MWQAYLYWVIGCLVCIVVAIKMARDTARSDGEYSAFNLTGSVVIGVICITIWPVVVLVALLYFLFRPLARFLNRKR